MGSGLNPKFPLPSICVKEDVCFSNLRVKLDSISLLNIYLLIFHHFSQVDSNATQVGSSHPTAGARDRARAGIAIPEECGVLPFMCCEAYFGWAEKLEALSSGRVRSYTELYPPSLQGTVRRDRGDGPGNRTMVPNGTFHVKRVGIFLTNSGTT